MCTIILLHGIAGLSPLVLAANRDERLDRRARGPRRFDDRTPRVVAPQDEVAGGTWLGVNEHGVVAAITNRFGAMLDDDRRSRGELVFRALEAADPDEAAERILALDATDYNGFHLTLSSPTEGVGVVWSDGHSFRREESRTGDLRIVTEQSFGAGPDERADHLLETLRPMIESETISLDVLQRVLSVRRPNDVSATCVDLPDMNYGTRSSTILAPEHGLLLHADGAPCETQYDDLSSLMSW